MELDATNADKLHLAHHQDLKGEVDSLAKPLIEKGEMPGVVVGVLLPDGSRHFYGYGVADQESGRTPGADTLFAVGSLSKGFLGATTAVLAREGKLKWSDTLAMYLPPEVKISPDAKKITVRQLATHTSGLPNQPVEFQTLRYFAQYLFTGKNFYRHLDEEHVFHYLSRFKAPREVEVKYSNLGYALLGYVVQRCSGESADLVVRQELLDPLGLVHTGYFPDLLSGGPIRARGYAGDQPKFIRRGKPVPDWNFTKLMMPTGGMYSNAQDLLTYAAAHLQARPGVLTDALRDTLVVEKPRPRDAPAVGWFADEVDGQTIVYQIGVVAGFTSYIGLDIQNQEAVVVLENSFNWVNRIGHKLLVRLGHARFQTAFAH